ncbi:ABC transporter substrate-binding protein [Amycolatopsis sp. NPDC058278]|uniref:ABC transporter substrate-binding protein n=1 Tax=Amycolatopsis sp. NPDC058278 TaxID=3346417 RepID=UPI0036D78463
MNTRNWVGAVAVSAAALLLTACGSADPQPATSSSGGFAPATQEEGSELTVWVDATRVPVVEAYQRTHPQAKLKIVTYSGNANGATDLQTKVQLFDRTGNGWPDVAFSATLSDTAWAAYGKTPYAAPVNQGIVDRKVLDGFSPGALDPCKVGDHVYCVRNDIAQVVLWYNKRLLDEFGYQVPQTWEDYQQLGQRVAKEHPGYLVGTAGDPWTPEIYLWAGQCPASTISGGKNVTVDLKSPKCGRAVSILDTLIGAGSLAKASVFDAGFIKDQSTKLLMTPGPSWYGQVLFNSTFKIPAGQIAAAAPLKYASDSETYTGNVGGGVWYVSSHSKNLKTAGDLVTWVTSSDEAQSGASTYPAYRTAATAWLAKQQATGYFADDVSGPLAQAAGRIWPGWSATQYSQEAIYAATVVPAINSGRTIASVVGEWQTAIENKAASLGYKVN